MKIFLLLLFVSSLVLAGCSAGSESLVGSWSLTAFGPEGSATPPVAGSQPSITFNEDGTLNGDSGCNGFSGEYEVDGDQISFDPLVSTAMACEEPLMSQEGAVFNVLNGIGTYTIEGDTLTITKDGDILMFTASQGQ